MALYLIPSTLGDNAGVDTLPAATSAVLHRLEHLVVETPKQARRFLAAAGLVMGARKIHFETLDEHTPDARLPALLAPAVTGHDVGLLSDAGCPCVADPGARLVRLAHSRGVRVIPLVGPSALLLALMASGLNGQRFAFHGYVPVDAAARARALAILEKDARTLDRTQIVIEAPYRNNRLLQAMAATLDARTLLCVAVDLTLPTEMIATRPVADWAQHLPDIDRRPAIFLFAAPR